VTVYGIDLGTTYSCVAYMDDAARPTVVRNLDESDTMPSVVYFERDNVVVGAAAVEALKTNPSCVKTRIKRDMGHQVHYEFWGQKYLPEEISAYILRRLAIDTAAVTGNDVKDVVISVPAYFGLIEREATKQAGELAGLNVIDILSEPIAAAISYGSLREGTDRTILVFDLGGGTFDTSVITMRDGDITVVCVDGDHDLGGADWDDELSQYLIDEFRRQHPDAADPATDPETVESIRSQAEQAKRRLSSTIKQRGRILYDGRVATVEVSRDQFEDLTANLLNRAIDITRRTVETAREKGVDHFDDVLLVGGSTKMPAVARRLHAEFGFTPKLFDPDLAVAKGTAIFAFEETFRRLLSRGGESAQQAERMATQAGLSVEARQAMSKRAIRTVASRSFGVVVVDEEDERRDIVDHVVHANDPLPAEKTGEYYTIKDNQTAIRVRIMEQAGAIESPDPADNNELDAGTIAIPRGKPRGWPIEVTFRLDRSGLLHVTAVERESGQQLDLQVRVR
jgi:molecular chaperone DnaK